MAHQPSVTRVCVLHLGDARGGIQRYSRWLAAHLRHEEGLSVQEITADFTAGPRWQMLRAVFAVAWEARHADVIILPYTQYDHWRGRGSRLLQSLVLHVLCRRRTITVLHDVFPTPGNGLVPDAESLALSLHMLLGQATVVHSDEDRRRLGGLAGTRHLHVIPHFVEPLAMPARDLARRAYGLSDEDFVVAVLGWIYPRKGHAAALEAVAQMHEAPLLWFLGGPSPGADSLLDDLTELARSLGIADRLTVTGYVSDAELNRRLAAVDLGLCPYLDASASGSLSTWVGSRTPVVASDIHVMREYSALAPEVIRLIPAGSIVDLATAITDAKARAAPPDSAFDGLLQARSPSVIAARYAQLCRAMA